MKNKTRTALPAVAAVALCLGLTVPFPESTIIRHVDDNDPLTEGFDYWPFNSGIATAAIPDDNGVSCWEVQNTAGGVEQATYMQLGGIGPYGSGSGLTQAEIDTILLEGCTLSMRARVLDGPVYDEAGTQLISGVVSVAGFSSFRFDIGLGRTASGETVVVLPELISLSAGQFSYVPFGSTIVVPGNDYHLYQLSYEPTSATALLLVDGVVRATGYPGSAVTGGTVANNYGLGFGALNLSTVRFADAHLEAGHVTATTTFRNAGANPASYTASPAALGSTWTASVDLSLTGHTSAQVLGYDSPAQVTLGRGQVLLVGGTKVFSLPLRTAPATWSVPIPVDPAIVGFTLNTQAAHVFGVTPFALSNAQDLTIGY